MDPFFSSLSFPAHGKPAPRVEPRRPLEPGTEDLIGPASNGVPVCGPLRDRLNRSPVETTEYRGYRIKATSTEDESGKWLARWAADRLRGSGAFSESGAVRGTVTSEGAADEAALREARAWLD